MTDLTRNHAKSFGIEFLITAAVVTVILWQVPLGGYILYPFSILATWFHEMGHGLTALLLGGNFTRLEIFPNGSGTAYHSGALFLGPLGRALVAAGGPMGPPIAGAGLILASRQYRSTHLCLLGLGSLLLLSAVIWVRSAFGLLIIPLFGLGVLAIALKTSPAVQGFVIQFLGVQACISTYHQIDYLLSADARVNGRTHLSDTSQIAAQLWLPYWFWAALIIGLSALLLISSLRMAYRNPKSNLTQFQDWIQPRSFNILKALSEKIQRTARLRSSACSDLLIWLKALTSQFKSQNSVQTTNLTFQALLDEFEEDQTCFVTDVENCNSISSPLVNYSKQLVQIIAKRKGISGDRTLVAYYELDPL